MRRTRMGGASSVSIREDFCPLAGKRIIVIDRRTFTFTNLATSGTQTTTFERALDVLGHREGTLHVVVNAVTMSGTQSLTVTATPVQIVDSDPLTDYLASTGAAATATLTATSTGKLIPAQLTAGFGSHLQFAINATQQTGGTALSCTITVILVLKDQ